MDIFRRRRWCLEVSPNIYRADEPEASRMTDNSSFWWLLPDSRFHYWQWTWSSDPFLGCCYLLYNADLLKIPITQLGETVLLFVDDAAVLVMEKTFVEAHQRLKVIMEWTGGIFNWACKHNCEFSIEKFQLVDFSWWLVPNPLNPRKKIPIGWSSLHLNTQVIKSQGHAKFLGVLVDNSLWWKEQSTAALTKGQDWVLQFRQLSKPTKGVSRSNMHRIYLAVAIPRMLYAADIFLTPETYNHGNRTAQQSSWAVIDKLSAVQWHATISITGGMSTTVNDILDVLSNLLPFHLLVERYWYQAALQLASLPKLHPLHKPISKVITWYIKRHLTPLHYLMHEYMLQPEKIKTIKTARHCNKWTPDFAICIAEMKDRAEEEDEQDRAEIQIYTDGSGLGGENWHISNPIPGGKEKGQLRYCLGSTWKHTVFQGECIGLILGMELLWLEKGVREVSFCVDSQAAIFAATGNKSTLGHYILDEFHGQQALTRIHNNMVILMWWTPGHRDIAGNETADEAAWKAAEGDTTPNDELPTC